MSLERKWDIFTNPLEAKKLKDRSITSALDDAEYSERQYAEVYTRPVPLNSEDATALLTGTRSRGDIGTDPTIQQKHVKGTFAFRIKMLPPPGRTLAADDGLCDATTLNRATSPAETARRLAVLPMAMSRADYIGKIPKPGDIVIVNCPKSDFKGAVSCQNCEFISIWSGESTPNDLYGPATDNLSGKLEGLFAGGNQPSPQAPSTDETEASTATTTAIEATAGGAPDSKVITSKETHPYNSDPIKLKWGQAKLLYQALPAMFSWIASYEGDYNSVVWWKKTGHKNQWDCTRTALCTGEPDDPKKILTQYTLGEVIDDVQPNLLKKNKGPAGNMPIGTAVGAYQLVKATGMKEAIRFIKNNHTENEWKDIQNLKFEKETQDALAVYLFFCKRPVLGNYVLGFHDNYSYAAQEMAYEWASVPIQFEGGNADEGCKRGSSAYCNGVNKSDPKKTPQHPVDFMFAYRVAVLKKKDSCFKSLYLANEKTHKLTGLALEDAKRDSSSVGTTAEVPEEMLSTPAPGTSQMAGPDGQVEQELSNSLNGETTHDVSEMSLEEVGEAYEQGEVSLEEVLEGFNEFNQREHERARANYEAQYGGGTMAGP